MKRFAKEHTFAIRFGAFALMIVIPILMAGGARAGQEGLVWGLLLLEAAVYAAVIAYA